MTIASTAINRVKLTMMSIPLQGFLSILRVSLMVVIMIVVTCYHTLQCSANVLGLTLEAVVALLTTAENTSMFLELGHADRGKLRGLVMLSSIVVNLVDGNGCVDNIRLDCLFLNYWLDGLMDMVMHMLASNSGCHGLAVRCIGHAPLIPELCLLGRELFLSARGISVIELSVLYRFDLGGVLLGKHFAVLHRLDCAVVVILMDLLVYSCVDLFMLMRLDLLMDNAWSYCLVDSGVFMAGLRRELLDR